ncbi:hypothetical protein QSU92_17250 [Microbacterium sp. ET2]|uniref:hypothetical protein n=1 Tax=Microbacterium albipurpureum TaxID=3050384 RepID=UPI00259C953C|nr:hypothetical protein [Microbacterium sp. ET2 (Ac-2212)]WJL95632.1 hypothetical protein QSU92_17250 [Microbacterium sp. ET2 (Ac-2212)]
MAIDSEHALLRSYRPVRRLDDTSAPWPGEVVRDTEGAAWLLVDASALGTHWAGWRASESEHLLTPADLVRTAAGHAALFPICSERVIDVVRRRSEDDDPLSAGEALTLAVSVLRGHLDAGATAGETAGTWWLTDEARPVLALQPAGPSESAEIFRLLVGGFPAWSDVLRDGLAALAQADLHERDAQALEARLFALTAPQPLRVGAKSIPSLRDGAVLGVTARPLPTRRGSRAAARAAAAGDIRGQGLLARVSTLMDRDLGETVSRATTGVWRAVNVRRPRSRRRGLIVAAGAAAMVLAVGLTWPSDAEPPAAAEPVVTAREPAQGSSPSPTFDADTDASSTDTAIDDAAPPPATPDHLIVVTDELLSARAACDAEAACLAEMVADPTRALPRGAADLPADARAVTFLDDLGGAAVLRVDATDTAGASPASQLVVIVRIGEHWVIRDIYDAGATS